MRGIPKIDMMGQKWGRLTVLDYVGNRGRWMCLCECGNEKIVRGVALRQGSIKSCGCSQYEKGIRHGRRVDLAGKRFGRLVAISDVGIRNRQRLWRCVCDCGNETKTTSYLLSSGCTQSCGCLAQERRSQVHLIDMTGQILGHLHVLERDGIKHGGKAAWLCQCDCGNKVTITGKVLRKGRTHCGCLDSARRRDVAAKRSSIRAGNIYGELVALERLPADNHNHVSWRCRCSCGNLTDVSTAHLPDGHTTSCGCKMHRRGSDSPIWKKDKNSHSRERLRDIEGYRDWQDAVFARDDYTCQICAKRGAKISPHHLDGYHCAKSKRTLLSNGVTLCKECHKAFHSMYSTRHNKRSQFVFFKAMHRRMTVSA